MIQNKAQIPMVRIALPLMFGVILSVYYGIIITGLIFWGVSAISISTLLLLNSYKGPSYNYRWVFGSIATLLLILSGIHITSINSEVNRNSHFGHFTDIQGYAAVRLTEPISEKANSYQINGAVLGIISADTNIRVSGKVILYLEKNEEASNLKYGDIIITENNFQPVSPPSNPNVFNFKRFLANSNIYHQAYARADSWLYSGKNSSNVFLSAAHSFRSKALNILESNNLSGREYAVASALVLGYREYLDEELQQGFAGAGAMHVLCVSGLHVGIIFLILKSALGFLDRNKKSQIIKTILIIFFIWLYAAITGFSPSVQRASTMFTFVAAGSSFSRQTNIYNTLAASAVFLIINDPYIITRIGFQLSYIAVIGIVSLQPPLYKLISIKNKLLDKAWAIITVSIAAQLATGPLGLYYFNQFPNYFILTNLIVIPLASIIIYAALLILITSALPLISSYIGIALSYLIMALHRSVIWIESLPWSVSSDIFISRDETFIIMALIISIGIALIAKKKRALRISLALCVLLFSSFSYRSISNNTNRAFIVYNVRNSTAIDFFTGGKAVFLACDNIIQDQRSIDFHIRDNRLSNGIKSPAVNHLISENGTLSHNDFAYFNNYITFNGKRMMLLSREHSNMQTNPPFKIDYLIITSNPRVSPDEILKKLKPAKVIIDSSNNRFRARSWQEACKSLSIEFYSVLDEGAYVKHY